MPTKPIIRATMTAIVVVDCMFLKLIYQDNFNMKR
jgi:hypothetical protein